MSDFREYLEERKRKDPVFAEEFEKHYESFKLNVMLRQLRTESGISQQELADMIGTKKSTISRMENHAEDVRFICVLGGGVVGFAYGTDKSDRHSFQDASDHQADGAG